MNIPSSIPKSEIPKFLQRQVNMGRYMIIGTVIITVVNYILLLTHANFYITYSAAVPYYLLWFGIAMDNNFAPVWDAVGTYALTGLVIGMVILAGYMLLWWFAKNDIRWIKVAMVLLIVDTVALLLFSFGVLKDPATCVWELVIHVAVIWEMKKGISAHTQLQTMLHNGQAEEAASEEKM